MVAKFKQPNYNTDSGTAYPLAIDAAIAVLAEQAAQFAVSAQDTPDMSVRVRGGRYIWVTGSLVVKGDETLGGITAPAANPRIDLIVLNLDNNGFERVEGAEAATPVWPVLTPAQIPIASISLAVGTAAITNSMIGDERAQLYLALLRWLLNRANTWTQWQSFDGGLILNNAGTAESLLYRGATGELSISTNRQSPGNERYFTFGADGAFGRPSGEFMFDAAGKMTAGTVPLARMGSVAVDSFISMSANTMAPFNLQGTAAAHHFYQYSAYGTDSDATVIHGSAVTALEAVSPAIHTYIQRRASQDSDWLMLVNGSAVTYTVFVKAYTLTET